jgi:hypothetical protein
MSGAMVLWALPALVWVLPARAVPVLEPWVAAERQLVSTQLPGELLLAEQVELAALVWPG